MSDWMTGCPPILEGSTGTDGDVTLRDGVSMQVYADGDRVVMQAYDGKELARLRMTAGLARTLAQRLLYAAKVIDD